MEVRLVSRAVRLTVRWTRVAMHRIFFKTQTGRKLCWLVTSILLVTTVLLVTSSSRRPPSPIPRDLYGKARPSPGVQGVVRVEQERHVADNKQKRLPGGKGGEAGEEMQVFMFNADLSNENGTTLSPRARLRIGGRLPRPPSLPHAPQDPAEVKGFLGRRPHRPSDRLDPEKPGKTWRKRPLSPVAVEGEKILGKGRPGHVLPGEAGGPFNDLVHQADHAQNRLPALPVAVTEDDGFMYLLQMETRQPARAQDSQDSEQPQGEGGQEDEDCEPHQHVFFAKVHKTGSSTIANILQRYGFARRLNFVLPRKRLHSVSYNYLSFPGQTIDQHHLIPPPRGQTYHILWNHAIYDSQFYHRLMPGDTLFVSILRHPLEQFLSTFEYYGRMSGGRMNAFMQQNVSNPLSVYLHNASQFTWLGGPMSYVRNKQAQDLGMNRSHLFNATLRRQYLQQLDMDFHWVMITEFFDESLVMLRRMLCWEIKDVLYIPRNKNPFKKKRVFTPEDKKAHRKLNIADYELYEFFLKRLKNTLAEQPADFHKEVKYFKNLQKGVQSHCLKHAKKGVSMVVKETPWSKGFRLDHRDCRLMQKHELLFMDDLVVDAVRRYQRSIQEGR